MEKFLAGPAGLQFVTSLHHAEISRRCKPPPATSSRPYARAALGARLRPQKNPARPRASFSKASGSPRPIPPPFRRPQGAAGSPRRARAGPVGNLSPVSRVFCAAPKLRLATAGNHAENPPPPQIASWLSLPFADESPSSRELLGLRRAPPRSRLARCDQFVSTRMSSANSATRLPPPEGGPA